jgi:hypothetical protein
MIVIRKTVTKTPPILTNVVNASPVEPKSLRIPPDYKCLADNDEEETMS